MADIIFYEAFKEEETALKELLPKKIKAIFTWKTIQEKGDTVPPAKILCVRNQSRIPVGWADELDGILTRSQGYDHLIAYKKAIKSKIHCGYLTNYCSRAVAEHAVMAMMVLLRKLKKQLRQFNDFKRDGITGLECKGRKALIVGTGRIGSQIAEIARGLKMQVSGVDIKPALKNIEYVSLKKGIKWADVIFCAVPLTDKTKAMFDYKALTRARKGLVFINVSRGEVSPIKDLRKLVEENILGGLSLDVYEDEKDLADVLRKKEQKLTKNIDAVMFLMGEENVLFTPHNAFNTSEAVHEKSAQTIASIVSFLNKKQFIYPVPYK